MHRPGATPAAARPFTAFLTAGTERTANLNTSWPAMVMLQ
jgi:hypothetical protein